MPTDPGEHFVSASDARERAQRALVGVPKDSVVVGLSAAAIWGMPLPPSAAQVLKGSPVSLSRRGAAAPTRRPKVDGHSIDIPACHCVRHDSLVLTTPARTWVDCAALVAPDHLLAMGDWALDQGLLTLEETASIITWARGRRGVVRAREVLPWIRTGVESGQNPGCGGTSWPTSCPNLTSIRKSCFRDVEWCDSTSPTAGYASHLNLMASGTSVRRSTTHNGDNSSRHWDGK